MEAAYLKAAVPEPYRIFGVRLLPLSIGRYRLLLRLECLFVAERQTELGLDDLLLGILICSMPCREFLDLIDSDRLQLELERWGKRIRREMAEDRYFSIFEKFALFRRYLDEGTATPRYWDEASNDSGSGGHWLQNLEVALRGELGYTNEEIEEGPISKALSDSFKLAENLGLIRLMTDAELAQGEANTALFEALLKKGDTCPASN